MSSQPENPVETPAAWFRYAEGDLGVAEREMRYQQPAYHTVCFLCQSAAEKYLKGYLIAQGWSLEKTHDMVQLIGLCADYDAELAAMASEGAVLNEYVIAGRYPGDVVFEHIGRAEAHEALEAAKRIQRRVSELTDLRGGVRQTGATDGLTSTSRPPDGPQKL